MIESRTTRQFREQLADLPATIRQQAVRAYRIFRNDPSHPSLHFKKVEGEEKIYSVRIGIWLPGAWRLEGRSDLVVLDRQSRPI